MSDSLRKKLPLSAVFVLAVWVWGTSAAGQQKYDFCSVCRAVVLEADEMIKNVDPRKTIQTGSFRVDPKGNQKIKDRQYARSNTHLEEVMESVCQKMSGYAERILVDDSRQLVRVQGYSNEYNDDLKLDYDKGKSLKYQCESYLEDFEEDIISYLQEGDKDNLENYICVEKTGVCTAQDTKAALETIERPRERHDVDVEDSQAEDDEDDDSDDESDDENTDDDDDDDDGSDDDDGKGENVDEKDEL